MKISSPLERVIANQQADLDELAAKAAPIAPGLDRTGMPPMHGAVENLAELETQARHRFSPRKNRWKEISEFDLRASELDSRRTEIAARSQEAHTQLANAHTTDADALARWIANGERGDRPESVRPHLEREIADLTRESDALVLAAGRELQAKASHVARHRDRLSKEARRHVEAAHAKVSSLLAQAEQARADLEQAREAELWALTFPDSAASTMPPFSQLAGGSRKVGERLGLVQGTPVAALFEALRSDSEWIKQATSPQQREALGGEQPLDHRQEAVWASDERAVKAERAEKREQLKAYRREWGHYP
jgi:hypothetical protein